MSRKEVDWAANLRFTNKTRQGKWNPAIDAILKSGAALGPSRLDKSRTTNQEAGPQPEPYKAPEANRGIKADQLENPLER